MLAITDTAKADTKRTNGELLHADRPKPEGFLRRLFTACSPEILVIRALEILVICALQV